jgi:hypothetical protein
VGGTLNHLLVVEALLKVPALNALAIFIGLGVRAVTRVRPVSAAAQSFTAV